jgi:hypothetical protein
MAIHPNVIRAARGDEAVDLHPDLRPGGIEWLEAAGDLIADIMHAAGRRGFDPERLHQQGLTTYLGDLEDDSINYIVLDRRGYDTPEAFGPFSNRGAAEKYARKVLLADDVELDQFVEILVLGDPRASGSSSTA